jgi:hypothetical protein
VHRLDPGRRALLERLHTSRLFRGEGLAALMLVQGREVEYALGIELEVVLS